MIDLRTGEHFRDGAKTISRRDACKGIAAIIAAGCAPSIVLAAGRSTQTIGGLRRGLGARVGMMGGGAKGGYITDAIDIWCDGLDYGGVSGQCINKANGEYASFASFAPDANGILASTADNIYRFPASTSGMESILQGDCTIEYGIRTNFSVGWLNIGSYLEGMASGSAGVQWPVKFVGVTQNNTNIGAAFGAGLFYLTKSSGVARIESHIKGVTNITTGYYSGTKSFNTPSWRFYYRGTNFYFFRLHHRALTTDEIAINYAEDLTRFGIT